MKPPTTPGTHHHLGPKPKPVEFLPDERAILDWLHKKVKTDATIEVTDTRLVNELGWKAEPERFFRAKMRLVAAGAIAMHVDRLGHQILTLLMPERKSEESRRYVFTVVPLELIGDVRKAVQRYRTKQFGEEQPKPLLNPDKMRAAGPGVVPAFPQVPTTRRRPDFEKARREGMQRLGVASLAQKLGSAG